MAKNVTLRGRTFADVSTIKIGTATFRETSEVIPYTNLSDCTEYTHDADWSTAGTGNIKAFVDKYFGYSSSKKGVFLAIVKDNEITGAGQLNAVFFVNTASVTTGVAIRNAYLAKYNFSTVSEMTSTNAFISEGASVTVYELTSEG